MDALRFTPSLPGLPDLRSRLVNQVAEHLHIWHSALMGMLATSGATLAHDANDSGWQAARGTAHHPT